MGAVLSLELKSSEQTQLRLYFFFIMFAHLVRKKTQSEKGFVVFFKYYI